MDAEPSLDYSTLLEIYDRTRGLTLPMSNEIVDSLEGDEINEAGRRLGVLRGGILALDSEAEMSVLMDFAIRYLYRDGKNAVQRFPQRTERRLSTEERKAVRHMGASRYRILDFERVEPGIGVMVTDRLTHETGLVVDRGLSVTASEGQTMAGTIVEWEKYWATTGAGLPMFDRVWQRLERPIYKRFGKPGPKYRTLDRLQEADLAGWCVRACLEAGVANRVAYL